MTGMVCKETVHVYGESVLNVAHCHVVSKGVDHWFVVAGGLAKVIKRCELRDV